MDVPESRKIAYRIGINLGDIIVDGDNIHGDGVNIAARLEQMADPGGICISGTAHDTTGTNADVAYESLGEVQVKNIQRPIRAYKVLTDSARIGVVAESQRASHKTTSRLKIGAATVILLFAAISLILFLACGMVYNHGKAFIEKSVVTTGTVTDLVLGRSTSGRSHSSGVYHPIVSFSS